MARTMLEELVDIPDADKSQQEHITAEVTAVAFAGKPIFPTKLRPGSTYTDRGKAVLTQ
jgi:hypothetical protein